MNFLSEAFDHGLQQHYHFVSQAEALSDASRLVGVFASPYSSLTERQVAIFEAGRNIGAIHDPEVSAMITGIIKKCANLGNGEVVTLSREEKTFIKAAIEGTFYKPFYE